MSFTAIAGSKPDPIFVLDCRAEWDAIAIANGGVWDFLVDGLTTPDGKWTTSNQNSVSVCRFVAATGFEFAYANSGGTNNQARISRVLTTIKDRRDMAFVGWYGAMDLSAMVATPAPNTIIGPYFADAAGANTIQNQIDYSGGYLNQAYTAGGAIYSAVTGDWRKNMAQIYTRSTPLGHVWHDDRTGTYQNEFETMSVATATAKGWPTMADGGGMSVVFQAVAYAASGAAATMAGTVSEMFVPVDGGFVR